MPSRVGMAFSSGLVFATAAWVAGFSGAGSRVPQLAWFGTGADATTQRIMPAGSGHAQYSAKIPADTGGSWLGAIASGPDGNLWFTGAKTDLVYDADRNRPRTASTRVEVYP